MECKCLRPSPVETSLNAVCKNCFETIQAGFYEFGSGYGFEVKRNQTWDYVEPDFEDDVTRRMRWDDE